MDPSEEQFFEQGEAAPSDSSDSSDSSEQVPKELEAPEAPELEVGFGSDTRARRARLQRTVGSALLASVALFGVGLLRHYGAPQSQVVAKKLGQQATLSALLPAAGTAQVPVAEVSATPAPAEPPTTPERGPIIDATALIRKARTLLEAGHTRDGVALARSAVNANPQNAEPYILLAAGLQDLGRWGEAQTVFATCKEATSSGPNATCRYFAGVR